MGHLRSEGFRVDPIDVSEAELIDLKARRGVRNELASCHTALIDGYVIEGHVPAADIRRLLQERPEVTGLTVPGMPVGSPGMEVPSGRKDHFDVLIFDEEGATRVYSRH